MPAIGATSKWLAGLIPIIVLWVMTARGLEHELREQLRSRTTESLRAAPDMEWASIHIAGRDILLTGQGADNRQRQAALDLLKQIEGVRRIDDRTTVRPAAPPLDKRSASGQETPNAPFFWSATRLGNELRLAGSVPPGEARHRVLTQIAALIPNSSISDKMIEAPGAPAPSLDMLEQAIRHLARLDPGSAQVTGTSYALRGIARDAATQENLLTEIRALPKVIDVGAVEIAVEGPRRALWRIERNGDAVVVTGGTPSDAVRQKLLASLVAAIPKARITDRQLVLAEAADGLPAAAEKAIAMVADMTFGAVDLVDGQVTVAGHVTSPAIAEQIKSDAKIWPPGFVLAYVDIVIVPVRMETAPAVSTAAPPLASMPTTCVEPLVARIQSSKIDFEPKKASLTSTSRVTLDSLGAALKECASVRVVVTGYGDPGGVDKRDGDLGRRRADAVAEILTRAGVQRDRVVLAPPGQRKELSPLGIGEKIQAPRLVEIMVVR